MGDVIPQDWKVPARFRQRIGRSAGRQRAMADGGHVLLILHEAPRAQDSRRVARLFWRQPDGHWEAAEEGKRPAGADGVAALRRHVEGYVNVVGALDDEVDKASAANELFRILRDATPLARSTRHLVAALQEARDAADDKDLIALRDQAQEVERAVELVLADANNALKFIEARSAEEQAAFARKTAESQHRLNLLGAMFFPITAVGAILGINLKSGLESSPPWVFWSVLASAFALGLIVRGAVAR